MVQCLLTVARRGVAAGLAALAMVLALAAPVPAGKIRIVRKPDANTGIDVGPRPADLLLEGGRKLAWERTITGNMEVRNKPGLLKRIFEVVVGGPDKHSLLRPYGIAVDSRGRIIITDPGAGGVHIFDFDNHKYKFIERLEKGRDPMLKPQCVAVDNTDNIYVTDSETGKIFVFNSEGKYQRALGSLKGGEGMFKRPTGIAVDSEARRIYVTDTLRDRIFVLDMDGQAVQTIGERGAGPRQFNYPTELLLRGNELAVVDSMNFRVQWFDASGNFERSIGRLGDSAGELFRPKGIGLDSEGHLYIVDGLWGVVQVFDREGRLLYCFGKTGNKLGDFHLPAGLFIDRTDRIYVVDQLNHRIQVFRYHGLAGKPGGGTP